MTNPVDQLETFFEETFQKMDRQFTSHEFFWDYFMLTKMSMLLR
ncbi:hypothetical protein BGP_1424 [Beggiatoa sp. PS]|nr:hypothetical protein BGP_1424 [Beggiatoa sp. PS]